MLPKACLKSGRKSVRGFGKTVQCRPVRAYEPALFSLVSPSRLYKDYCTPVSTITGDIQIKSTAGWRGFANDDNARYYSVNAANVYSGLRTIEIRMHSGTYEASKILT